MARARLVFLALTLAAAPLGAQAVDAGSTNLTTPATVTVAAPGPRLDAGAVALRQAESTQPLVMNAAATHANMGQAKALMIVGAAAFVAGAIIGDTPGTIIMVGGAAVGLVGLYQYLQ